MWEYVSVENNLGGKRIFGRRGKFRRTSLITKDDIAFYLIAGYRTFSLFFGRKTDRRVYLLASDTLDYSLNVRQIDRHA